MTDGDDALSPEEQRYFDTRGEEGPAPEQTPNPATEEQPTEEPSGGDEGEGLDAASEGQDQPAKAKETVPLATLLEERKARKAFEAKLAEIEKQNAILSDRWDTLLKAQQAQPQPQAQDEDPEPDPEKDIFAHQAWISRQLKKQNEQRAQQEAQQAEQQRHAQLEGMVTRYWHEDTAEFAAKTPDFGDAAKFLAEARDKQLAALGTVNPALRTKAGRDQVINAELQQIIINCAQQRISPAQAVYEMSKAWGYAGPAPKQGANDPAKALSGLQAAVEGAKSVGAAGGSAAPARLSAADIANLPAKEFEAWLNKAGDDGFRRILGG